MPVGTQQVSYAAINSQGLHELADYVVAAEINIMMNKQ